MGMPDVTGGPPPHQQLGAGGVAGPPAPAVSAAQLTAGHVGKAPDILRTEQLPPVSPASAACPPAVPSSDRNLFMETGELAEEDVARVSLGGVPPPAPAPASLPPMVGGNEPPGGLGPRLVEGEGAGPAPALAPRLGEGDGDEVEVVHVQPPPLPGLAPPPLRQVEGESRAPPPPPPQLPREPVEGESSSSQPRPQVPGLSAPAPQLPPAPPQLAPPPAPGLEVEPRSEAAGSDRRDVDMMGPSVVAR